VAWIQSDFAVWLKLAESQRQFNALRQNLKRNSEYLAQRRQGRKGRRKMMDKRDEIFT